LLLLWLLILAIARGASAQGVSLDTQQLHPSFAPGGWQQHPGARLDGSSLMRVGAVHQLELSPLLLKLPEGGMTDLMPHRFTTTVGAFVDIKGRFGFQLSVPMYGLDLADGESRAQRPAVGDVATQLLLPVLQQEHVALALTGQVAFPTSTPEVWIGERGVRIGGGFALEAGVKRLSAMLALTVLSRMDIDTGMGVEVGDELRFQAGVGVALVPDRWSLMLEWHNATAFAKGDDPANACEVEQGLELPEDYEESAFYGINPMELRLGTRVYPAPWLRLDVAVGMRMNRSIGAPALRVLAGMSVIVPAPRRTPKVKDEPEQVAEATEPEVDPLDDLSVNPDDEPSSGPHPLEDAPLCLALGAPILFEQGSDRLSAQAELALDLVVRRIHEDPEIAHVIVEGHASCEGEPESNFDLSLRRAVVAYRYLVNSGVSSRRLSYRGLGELLTTDPLRAEAPVEDDRRVLVCVPRQLDFVDDPIPDWAAIAVPPPWDPGRWREPMVELK